MKMEFENVENLKKKSGVSVKLKKKVCLQRLSLLKIGEISNGSFRKLSLRTVRKNLNLWTLLVFTLETGKTKPGEFEFCRMLFK